mmetsp:Transcript_33214/g.81623  ORF Transcript_33214/g.81623 Transcript_33214/m.81623 type:complete len:307 (+) Transcript_33214:570-1490(+)
MSTTSCPPGRIAAATAGNTLSTEMNDRSSVAMSTGSGSGCRWRRLVRSITTTLGSTRTRSATWPYPTSMPYTRAAPFCSMQSVNPPVESPESSATLPSTLMPNSCNAFSSLSPPRHTYLGTSAMISSLHVDLIRVPALVTGWPSTSTFPCAIHDCATVRLYSGKRSQVSSSKRWRPGVGFRLGSCSAAASASASRSSMDDAVDASRCCCCCPSMPPMPPPSPSPYSASPPSPPGPREAATATHPRRAGGERRELSRQHVDDCRCCACGRCCCGVVYRLLLPLLPPLPPLPPSPPTPPAPPTHLKYC